jgi:hypothetical protein
MTKLESYVKEIETIFTTRLYEHGFKYPFSMGFLSETSYIDTFVYRFLQQQDFDVVKMDLGWLNEVQKYEPKSNSEMQDVLNKSIIQLQDKAKPVLFINNIDTIHNLFSEPIMNILDNGLKLEGKDTYVPVILSSSFRFYDFNYHMSKDAYHIREYVLDDNRALRQAFDTEKLQKNKAIKEFQMSQQDSVLQQKIQMREKYATQISYLTACKQVMNETVDKVLMNNESYLATYHNNPKDITPDTVAYLLSVHYTFNSYRKLFEREDIKPLIEAMYDNATDYKNSGITILRQSMKLFYLFTHLNIKKDNIEQWAHLEKTHQLPESFQKFFTDMEKNQHSVNQTGKPKLI